MTMQNQKQEEFILVGESVVFSRLSHKDGELLEVKIQTRTRTPVGVSHENIQTVVLGADQSQAVTAGLRMLLGQVQAIVAAEVSKLEEKQAEQPEPTPAAGPDNAE